ncbi:MAG TPA: PAS domain S-box protein [Candidatus Binatia bacterium]
MPKKSTKRGKASGQARTGSSSMRRNLRSILVDTSPDALSALAPDSTVLFWSAGAEAVYGYSKHDALGKRLSSLVAPEMAEPCDQLIREAVESGIALQETVHRKKDGSAIYVDITAKAVCDRRGELQFITASHKDVTQIKVLSHGKVLDARYRGLLETVPDAIVMVNNTGRIVLINGQGETLFGYTRGEIIGKPIEILLPERFRRGHVGHRTHYFSEPKTRTMGAGLELFACHRDGAEFPVEISLSPLITEEGTFAMSAIRDVTDRKKLQEELRKKNDELEQQNRLIQQANRLKSEFLANMSHELRTPLNGIIGFAEIMHDEKVGPISPDHKEYLQDILTSGRHLLQLINDVLDLSKVEAGKFEFVPERTDPAILVGEVCEIVRTLAATKRIALRTESDPALADIEADARSLKQVLYNYISNAIKFTPNEGAVIVRVKPEGADDFRIEVEDNGVGIRAEDLSRLFVEFQQLDTGSSKQYAGTGLGLALTKKIVEAQGGRVGVSSNPGAGSIFHAILPRVFRGGPKPREDPQPVHASPGASLILVIEDDVNDRTWIASALQAAGYAVHTVATGAEALVRCRERKYDAITLDIMLPDMSGRAVFEKLRERGLNRQTPVTVVTLLAHKGVVAGFQVNDILSKPVSHAEIVKALERCGVTPSTPRPILVVDDDQSALKLADEMLRQLGYRTVCRQNASSALQAASRQPLAAVVLDLIMPAMNGFEFLKRFRRSSRGRHTPVIVWTSKDLTDAERAELRSAASAISKKDQDARELVRELQSILRVPGAPAQETYER